ncbi:MAG: hypothetical protein GQ564_06460 [Bacteroidales bacterium]|nr:hypothetical protein [Bacteroidales bacterium]
MGLFKITTGIMALSMLFSNCEEESNSKQYDLSNQKILFQYEYSNHAWGYQHHGWMIDSAGDVHCYNLPDNWHNCDSLGLIDESLLESNLLQADSVCFTVDKIKLGSMLLLIEEAAKGEKLDPKQKMYDAGTEVYKAYILNTVTNKYESVILKQTGDYQIENKSQAAEELYNWLYSIKNEIKKSKRK